MTPVECNSIGVASIKGIFCFQSAQFNCGVQPGGSATFTCRGLAGVAQTVGEVWNTTINTAAKVAEEMADAIAKREQQAAAAARAKAGSSTPLVLAGPVAPTTTSSSSKHSSVAHGDGSSSGDGVVVGGNGGQAWRAGANAALEAVRDQPFFQNLAHMVSNATHSLLNKTADGVVSVAESAKSAFGVGRQTTFDLGPPPIKDAAGGLAAHTATLLLVSGDVQGHDRTDTCCLWSWACRTRCSCMPRQHSIHPTCMAHAPCMCIFFNRTHEKMNSISCSVSSWQQKRAWYSSWSTHTRSSDAAVGTLQCPVKAVCWQAQLAVCPAVIMHLLLLTHMLCLTSLCVSLTLYMHLLVLCAAEGCAAVSRLAGPVAMY
jgi:hypothetical protein